MCTNNFVCVPKVKGGFDAWVFIMQFCQLFSEEYDTKINAPGQLELEGSILRLLIKDEHHAIIESRFFLFRLILLNFCRNDRGR